MAEKIIHSIDELVDFIRQTAASKEIGISDLEKQSNLSQGMISRWQSPKCQPQFRSMMRVLDCLNIELYLKSVEEQKVDEDILASINTLISSDMTLSDKKQLLSIIHSITSIYNH